MNRKLPLSKAAGVLALAGIFTAPTYAQSRQQQELLRNAREASSLLEGTWVLQTRFTPSGKPHRQPLQGEFTVKLGVDPAAVSKYKTSATPGTLATGTMVGRETGVLDGLMSVIDEATLASASKASNGRDVLFEMNGSSELELNMSGQSPDMMTLVYKSLELKGTYGVFRQGVRSRRLPTTYKKTDSGFLFFRRPVLTLVNGLTGASDLEMPSNPTGPGSPGDKSHDIVRQVVRGDRMEITYGNGGRDIYIKKRPAAEN